MVTFAATDPSVPAAPAAFAALDLGTNNCRLLVGAPTSDGFRVLDSFSRIVRLGEGLAENGRLGGDAMERTIAALHGCAARLRRRPVQAVRAIATEACRQATNGREFLHRARAETGLHIDVISSREEAELALESCTPLLRGSGRRALLFDIGGGSTEVAWVRLREDGGRPELIGTISLPVGVVTLAERFSAGGPEVFEKTVEQVASGLRRFEAVHCIRQEIGQGGVAMLGTSGTVTTLAGIVLDLPRYTRAMVDGFALSHEAATAALARLHEMGHAGIAAHPCIGPERAEFVLPGCAIFEAIRRVWPAPHVTVADRGLREGMLLRMIRGSRLPGRTSRPRHRPGHAAATL